MKFKLSPLFVLCAILAGVLPLGAQQKGQYVPGQFGLNVGIMPSPGFTYANMEINYNTDTLNNPSGNAVPPKPTLNLPLAGRRPSCRRKTSRCFLNTSTNAPPTLTVSVTHSSSVVPGHSAYPNPLRQKNEKKVSHE